MARWGVGLNRLCSWGQLNVVESGQWATRRATERASLEPPRHRFVVELAQDLDGPRRIPTGVVEKSKEARGVVLGECGGKVT